MIPQVFTRTSFGSYNEFVRNVAWFAEFVVNKISCCLILPFVLTQYIMWQLYIHNIQVNTPNFKDRLQLIKPMITPYVLIFGSRSHISWNGNKDVDFTEMSFFILRLNNWVVLTHVPR